MLNKVKGSPDISRRIGLVLFVGLFAAAGAYITVNVFAAGQEQAHTVSTGWPDATNTGTTACPALTQVSNPAQIILDQAGSVYENKELMNPGVIAVRASNVTVRCVKWHGTGYFGIDNSAQTAGSTSYTDVNLDRVEIDCQDKGQVSGMQLHNATIRRSNVHHCDGFVSVAGDSVTIKDSFCHDLTAKPGVHASCVRTMGGGTGLNIEHNSFWGRDTADVLLGREYGQPKNVVINNNRFMSAGTPLPAYLLYLAGANTVVSNNRFTRQYSYGACTLNTGQSPDWTNNVWDDNGEAIPGC